MARFIVAGGAGFIGSHICERLLKEGNKVICLDNLITGSEENISGLKNNQNFTYEKKNIVSDNILIEGEIDGIFHLASPASPNAKSPKSYMAYPIETLLVNSLGTKKLLDIAVSKNCPIVFASSSEVYGDPEVSPQPESYLGKVNPVGKRSVYDEGKRFGEALCMAYSRKLNTDVRITRIFNTYGDKMQKDDGRVVSNFINQALQNLDITVYGDGNQTRSFCYVDDLVDGLFLVMQTQQVSGKVINLGNPEEYKIRELAGKIKDMTGSASKVVFEDLPEDDPSRRNPDISKAKELLGFSPKVSLDEGLRKTIEYFRRQL